MKDILLDVSVIICAYTEERWSYLVAAVESVQQQTTTPREIIVVIDHNQSLRERVQAEIPGIAVVENRESPGLSGARNSGIAVAKGVFIAFLDDDAIAEPDWLERLCECCVDPQVLGAGGIVEPLWMCKRPDWFPEEFNWVVGCTYGKLSRGPIGVRNPYGGCICIRREVFGVVGGFRNDIGRVGTRPLGGEDTEFCIRAKQHWPQKVFLCEPQAQILHHVSPYRVSWRYFRSRCYGEGLSKAIVSNHVGVRDGLASELSYTFNILPRAIARGVADGLFRFDLAGFLRAGALIAGLTMTVAGYLVGMLSLRLAPPNLGKALVTHERLTLPRIEEI